MALEVHVHGPALLLVTQEGGANNTLEQLGYTRDGVRVRVEGLFEEVRCDQTGGEAGLPVELLYHGDRAIVELELTKWDALVADKIAKRLSLWTGSVGVIPPAGQLVFATGNAYRLVIAPGRQGVVGWDFPRAIPQQPLQINKGSRASVMFITFQCYPKLISNQWVLYQPYTGS